MALLLLLLFVVLLMLAIATIVGHADGIVAWAKTLATHELPPPPHWVGELPLVGERLSAMWEQAVAAGAKGLIAHLAPYADDIARWFVAQAGSAGFVFVQFVPTALLAAVMSQRDSRLSSASTPTCSSWSPTVSNCSTLKLIGTAHWLRGRLQVDSVFSAKVKRVGVT